MKLISTVVIVILVPVALSGCAYKPLKAPCSPDEGGTPLAYSDVSTPHASDALRSFDRCGPMRPI